MVRSNSVHSSERVAILQWVARLGAVTAEALAEREGSTVASARSRLIAAERDRLLLRQRPLAGQPALYTVTPAGLRASGLRGLEPCRVSAAGAWHAIVCAAAATALERSYPDYRVLGERELRRDERERDAVLASAKLGTGAEGQQLLHRPDLVLWPVAARDGLPVAVEVELTIKSPRRLLEICTAWARCRCVSGVLYLGPPEVERALGRAIEKANAHAKIVVVPLDSIACLQDLGAPAARTVPGDA
jgi:hypothetical protein